MTLGEARVPFQIAQAYEQSTEPTIRYNLACYECQLGDLAVAKQHLKAATKADTKFRGMALDDPDLEPLWSEIGRLEA